MNKVAVVGFGFMGITHTLNILKNADLQKAKKALMHNKHVFHEKPFCLDIKQAEELISLAEQKKKILMVGQVVRFIPPCQKLKHMKNNTQPTECMPESSLQTIRLCYNHLN